MIQFFVMFGTAFVVIQCVMLLFWGLYLFQRNVSVVDIAWGVAFLTAAIVDFILGDGFLWRKVLILCIVSVWAIRLICHLVCRYRPEKHDARYALLMEGWPLADHPLLQAWLMFALQGILVAVLSLPFALMCQNTFPFFSSLEVFGLLFWVLGVLGEAAADRQLEQFKQDPNRAEQVCDHGLWRYSRHPNYFFEWVVWLGFSMMAFSSPLGWLGILSPLLMLFLLLKVSGVPLVEAHLLESKGDAYLDYQKRTSVFFPWFSYKRRE